MNRLIQNDYDKIVGFFNDYSLKEISTNEYFNVQSKNMHRKLYSLILFINEMKKQNTDYEYISNVAFLYFCDVAADLIMSYFCWINGAYKPAELQLRSSIESFLKAVSYDEKPQIITLKNVYEVFDLSLDTNSFSNEICKKKYDLLKDTYSKLCATAHGALDKLSDIGALIKFPEYDVTLAKVVVNNFERIINSYLCVIYWCFYENVYLMHEFNRELFFQGLLKADKRDVFQNKTK